MSEDPTPRSAAKLTIEDFIVREMRAGFRDVHNRIDAYRGEAQKGNAKLEEHIRACDRRYGEMITDRNRQREPSGANATMKRRSPKDWLVEKIKDRFFDWLIVTIIALVYFALTHGAKLTIPT